MTTHASSAERTTSLLEDAAALAPDVTHLRHRLHREPEIGLELPRTQEKVLEWLDGLGLEVSTGRDTTSVTAVLRGGAGEDRTGRVPSVLLRGDMDALPVTERTGLEYASVIDGAMHACGHDLHTAMLAGAATLLSARRDQLPGDVVFMFQPGEEGYDGASVMIDEGVLDAPGRRVDAAYGQHVMAGLAAGGQVLGRPGTTMSSSAALFVDVIGRGGHGSAPHLAADPVPAAAEIIGAIQAFVTRRFDVFDPVVVTVGVLRAGTKRNIIPDTAHLEATVRAFSHRSKEVLARELPSLVRSVAAAHGLDAAVEYKEEYPLTVNNPLEFDRAARSARELLGDSRFEAMPVPLSGSEDFSRVLHEVPGAFVYLSAVPEGVDPATVAFNHSPRAVFDDKVLATGTALYARLAMDRLEVGA
jgi:amidohydrolase